jgi:AcrR family transcriptional regulator
MVRKYTAKRPRGRPRQYEPGRALQDARDAFWDGGFASTSLDDLSAATGMNRPSLYAAFGDKRALYLKTVDRYRELGRHEMQRALAGNARLADALRRMYTRALTIYLSGERGARGCYLVGTAATEAINDREIRSAYASGLHELDDLLEARMREAMNHGELSRSADPRALARVACAVMNGLALRARAGDSRSELNRIADTAVHLICGNPATA